MYRCVVSLHADSNKLVVVSSLALYCTCGDNNFRTSHDTSICSSKGTKVTFWGASDGAGGLREEGFQLKPGGSAVSAKHEVQRLSC